MTLVDYEALVACAARLDLREPNTRAVESLAAELSQWFEGEGRAAPFEGIIDAATGVGKTYILAAAIEYLSAVRGTRNYAIITPGRTILEKTVGNFSRGHPKSLLDGMDVDPVVITSENFNSPGMRRAMDDDSQVKLFIFTVQALTRPTSLSGRKTHKFQEGLGRAFYEHLDAQDDLVIFADEHHCYYGPGFSSAVRDLTPFALVGLTATPHRRTPEDQIIYRYPLAAAIADGLVKTPVLVGRKDDRTDMETKLLDGIRLLDAKQRAIGKYVRETGDPNVNPVMLVIASSIEEAEQVAETLRSRALAGGRYGDAVLVVHSKKPDQDLAQLAEVEEPDSPIRIIVSVGMLKEGWDVKNVYVIASLRSSVSEILTEQTLGRGLRLPWGRLTGWELLDTLEVIAHERYEQLLKKAKVINEAFIDHRTRAVIRKDAQGREVATTERQPVSLDIAASHGAVPQPIGAGPAIQSVDDRAQTTTRQGDVAELLPRETPIQLYIPELRMSPIRSAFQLARIIDLDPFHALGRRLARDPAGELRRIRLSAHVVETLDGLRHTELAPGETIDRVDSPASLIPLEDVRRSLEEAVLAAPVVPARRGQREQLQPILNAFLDGLGPGADTILSGYLDRAAAALIGAITDEHRRFVAEPEYEESISLEAFGPVRHARATSSQDRYGQFKRGVGYVGWARSLYDQVWFDSSTERDLANLIDTESSIDVWARLHHRDLEIRYRAGNYNPDFLAVEGDKRWVIETKADRDMIRDDVQAKRRAAREWANVISADPNVPDQWGYILVSEADLAQAKDDWGALVQAVE